MAKNFKIADIKMIPCIPYHLLINGTEQAKAKQ